MKIKFSDFGRCLICLHNPCDCKKTERKYKCDWCKDTKVFDGEYCDCSGKVGMKGLY